MSVRRPRSQVAPSSPLREVPSVPKEGNLARLEDAGIGIDLRYEPGDDSFSPRPAACGHSPVPSGEFTRLRQHLWLLIDELRIKRRGRGSTIHAAERPEVREWLLQHDALSSLGGAALPFRTTSGNSGSFGRRPQQSPGPRLVSSSRRSASG